MHLQPVHILLFPPCTVSVCLEGIKGIDKKNTMDLASATYSDSFLGCNPLSQMNAQEDKDIFGYCNAPLTMKMCTCQSIQEN